MKNPRALMLLVFVALALSCGGCVVVINLYTDHDSTGSTGAGGTGGAGGCAPGEIVACYDGPAGTEGVGLCKPGSKTCAADGASFGPCEGAILPVAENCSTPVDEDCDGLSALCSGSPVWSRGFGDANTEGNQYGNSIAVDHNGAVLVAGSFSGSLSFGNGPLLVSEGFRSGFIAKLSASGNAIWAKNFEGTNQTAASVTVDGTGNVLVTGNFSGSVNFGDGLLKSAGGTDGFIVKLDANGKTLWSKRFGDGDVQEGQSVAVDNADNVLVTGYFMGSVDFGDGVILNATSRDGFVMKVDANGKTLWSKRFGSYMYGASVAADGAGNVLLAGSFGDSITFGADVLVAEGALDVFVTKLDASGNPLWSKRFGGAAGYHYGANVAVDRVDNVLVVGAFSSSIDFGAGVPLVSMDGNDGFVAKLDMSGNPLWSKQFGDAGDQAGLGIASDSGGNVLVTGYFTGAIAFDGSSMASSGKSDAFLAKLDASGSYFLWSKLFGDSDDQAARSVALNSADEVFVTGSFDSTIDFGDGSLISAGAADVFVAKFSP